jgi:Tfp pilus assembly protein PilO
MAKNKLSDLRDHLFSALERIDDDQLNPEELDNEIKKANAVANLSSMIIQSAKIEVDFIKVTGRLDSKTELFKSVDTPKQLD